MAAYAPQSSERAIAQINITPLVDVMLVLLVIFMLAAPAVTGSMSLNLPQSSDSDAERPPRAVLRITETGQYVVDGRALSANDLPAALAGIAAQRAGTVLEIDAAAEVDYQRFATALAAARSSGLRHVRLQP